MIEGGIEITKCVIKNNIAQRIAVFIGVNNIEDGLSPFNSRNIDDLQKELNAENPDVKNIIGDILIEIQNS